MKRGRPSIYTPELGDAICERLANGESLRAICRDDQMPGRSACLSWASSQGHDFAGQYARARVIGYESVAEEIIEIADGCLEDDIEQRKFRVDARKWYLSKMLPKIYGDKLTTESTATLNIKDDRGSLEHLLGLSAGEALTPKTVLTIEGKADEE